MIRLIVIFFFLAFGVMGCHSGDIDPTGTYSLKRDTTEYILNIDATNAYSMTIFDSEKKQQFSGSWEWDDKNAATLSFSGIVWHGVIPEGAPGFWRAKLEGSRGMRICLDGEGINCFEKKKNS